MNVVHSGNRFQVYGEDLKTYHNLPCGSYEVSFSKTAGFFLTSRPDLTVNEEKIYGNHDAKITKVLSSFALTNRNFGVILSGQKGIGKSLFARSLAARSISSNLPVIIVSAYIPGVADFIGSIEQEVVVIFDEFEKTFAETDEYDPQTEMLSLFDGLDGGKKLFVITCNRTENLSEYMLNRPGRFHYHIKLDYPTDEEIAAYLSDKLSPEYYHEIERVLQFSRGVNLTYDSLRAIAFELNQGYSITETLSDLNITDYDEVRFDIELELSNGMCFCGYGCFVDFSDDYEDSYILYSYQRTLTYDGRPYIRVYFKYTDVVYDDGLLSVPIDKIRLENLEKLPQEYSGATPLKLTLRKVVPVSKLPAFVEK